MINKNTNKLDWHYTEWGGKFATLSIKLWALFFRKTNYEINLDAPLRSKRPTVVVSNHQTLLDPPGIFAALSVKQLLKIPPVKFMTWHKYYNSIYKLPLYTTGCYPSHGEGLTGVEGAVYYAKHGYLSFIFPEGKRVNDNEKPKVYDGVVRILEQLPEARLILVNIDWEKRVKFFSRPKLSIKISDAPKLVNRSSANSIMKAVYDL